MAGTPARMLTRVHHVGLVVRKLEDGLALWRDTFGLRVAKEATVLDQGVRAALLPIGHSEIELLEPVNASGGVAKFLEKRGEGLHHVCFETPGVAAELDAARAKGFPLIDERPRPGLAGDICFLHPKGTRGVLVEFATPPREESLGAHGSASSQLAGLALAEVTARSKDAATAADLFHTKLGLVRAAVPTEAGMCSAAVSVGGVRLRFVAADPASAGADAAAWRAEVDAQGEGLAALVLEVDDLGEATGALAPLGPVRTGDGLTLAPARCHGVPLRIRRA